MSCLFVLDDGRACAPSPWAFDAIIAALAEQLTQTDEERQLASWLRDQMVETSLVGHRVIDLRELTPESRRLFRLAVQRAAAHVGYPCAGDGVAVATPGWIQRLRRLARMIQSIDRGESPDALSDVPAPIAPSGLRRGPGWRAAVA